MKTRLSLVAVLLVLVGTLVRPLSGQGAKQMAITFDDLPFAYPGSLTLTEQRTAVNRVLAALDKHNVKAMTFVNGREITADNRDFVDAVVNAGHSVGNHTFSHSDLGAMNVADYVRDIELDEQAIQPWQRGGQYFRYPYLRQGETVQKRDAVLAWLASRSIVVAPVSIDNNDYLYNRQLVDAKAEGQAVDVRSAYLDHMSKCAAFYDGKARTKVGRPVKQILLLHMNYLNALYLDDLLQRFRSEGWSFISFVEAVADDVYRLKYNYVGPQGAGHLDAISAQ